jgi:TRAP-type mannitol/chloroaromatic compound transport system substrate-binding protein
MTMQRRKFLTASGAVGGAAAALAAPAIARSAAPKSAGASLPAIRNRWARSSAPWSSPNASSKLTNGRFKISVHPAGEVVPALQVLDAVQNGSVELGQSASCTSSYRPQPGLRFSAPRCHSA